MKNLKNFIEVAPTEEEQVERFKTWFKENVIYIILGIAVGFGGLFSWDYYTNYQARQDENARNLYLDLANTKDVSQAEAIYNQLQKNHSQSIYLPQSGLLLAKVAAKNNKFNLAKNYLESLTIYPNYIIAQIARFALAEILIEQNQLLRAITILNIRTSELRDVGADSYFEAMRHNLLGDIYMLQNNKPLAKSEYEAAQKLPGVEQSGLAQILSIKLQNL